MEDNGFGSFERKRSYGGGDAGGTGGGGGGFRKPGGKRSFLKQQKRFGKQGRLGRGSSVDDETYAYFVRILELLTKDEFENDEDRETFAENSLGLTEGSEVQLSSNQLVSRVVENILPLASEDSVHRFCEAFTPSLRVIVTDPFASHVLEKLLVITSSDKWIESEKLCKWFENTAKFILNNFEDFTFDKYASFVMKKVMECLSGFVEEPEPHTVVVAAKKHNSMGNIHGKRLENVKREKILVDFARRFVAWPQYNDLVQRDSTSRLMQNVIQTVARTKFSDDVLAIIRRTVDAVPVTHSDSDKSNHILEVCLGAADEDLYGVIFAKYFEGHLEKFAASKIDRTLQKIIATAPNETYFSNIFNEMLPSFESCVRAGKIGIIHALVNQCVQLKILQKDMWNLLKDTCTNISENPDAENLVITLLALGIPRSQESRVGEVTSSNESRRGMCSYYGATTVELLLDFDKPSGVLKCMTALETDKLMKLATDPKGSFVITKVFKSDNVPQKQKQKIFGQLKELSVELATTKYGSRIMDSIWSWADLSKKCAIVEILSQRIPLLSSNKFGNYFVKNYALQNFQRNRKEWSEHMASESKKAKDLQNIASELGIKIKSDDASSKKTLKRASEQIEIDTRDDNVETIMAEADEVPRKKRSKKSKKSKSIDTEQDE